MGAVSIWSMHYIGNRALIMIHGPEIVYRSGYTASSFFLPISLVGSAFYAFGISEKVSILWTMTGGVLVGASVCGMHYISQQGISNYALQYSVGYVVGAAVIAVAASTIAMGIFFYLTVMWTNSCPRRLACAALLAAAVSGMHWSATVGTSYRAKVEANTGRTGLSGGTTALMVLFLVKSPVKLWRTSPPLTFCSRLDVVSPSWVSRSLVNVPRLSQPPEPSKLSWLVQPSTRTVEYWSPLKVYCPAAKLPTAIVSV